MSDFQKSKFDVLLNAFTAQMILAVVADRDGDDPGMEFDRTDPEAVAVAVETLIDTDDISASMKARVRTLLQNG